MSRQFKVRECGVNVEKEFDLNINRLGCVMLDLSLDDDRFTERIFEELGLEPYYSDNPEQFWINGITSPEDLHVTVRFGLMPQVRRTHVYKVINSFGLHPELLNTEERVLPYSLNYFEGFNNEYGVLVAEIRMGQGYAITEYIQDMHNALGVLPNLATFSPPTFHMTLGYFRIKKYPSPIRNLGSLLQGQLAPVTVKGISYGKHMQA